jgi:hypothetical protein
MLSGIRRSATRAYLIELRERGLTEWDAGESTGDIAARRGKTVPEPKLVEQDERITKLVRQSPVATLQEQLPKLGLYEAPIERALYDSRRITTGTSAHGAATTHQPRGRFQPARCRMVPGSVHMGNVG